MPNSFPPHLLLDLLGPAHGWLCTAMPDLSCICKIGRTNPSDLADTFLGITTVFAYSRL